ncbi:MAG TPA: NirD/YgiW/YdeI family stress tolerance protein [Balneolaceae bacterium]|nr:NirD/YgiW/YdeI family stress tolerance protein [Balneolaceae bacterium]
MKKSALFLIILLFALTSISKAQFTGNGDVVTVQQVKDQQNDGSYVTLEGFIVKRLGDELYLFRDDTGEIEVEIDDEVWQGQEVDANTKVRIQGEVDEDLTSVTIEVEKVSAGSGSGSDSGGWG